MRVEGLIKFKKIKIKGNEILGVLNFVEKIEKEWVNQTIGFTYNNIKAFEALNKQLKNNEMFEIVGNLCKSEKNFYIKISKLELCKNKYKNLGSDKSDGNLDLTL